VHVRVLLIKKLGYEGWKQLKDACRRWIAEIIFSSIKRVLGENLLSKKFKAQKSRSIHENSSL
jgi:DNA-binding MurR/RpiR family transcriptional regulator